MEGKPQWMNNELRSRRSNNKWTSNSSHSSSNIPSNEYNNYVLFMRGSRSVARDLFSTYQKLEKINYLARKRTIFDGDEASKELNELVYIVKQDITSLNQQIESLRQQQLQALHQQQSKNIESHSKNVVFTLQQQLASISNNFKNTLELRTQVFITVFVFLFAFTLILIIIIIIINLILQNLAQQKLRREQFTTSSPMTSHSSSTVIDFNDDSIKPNDNKQQKQLLIYEDQTNEFLEERANTMQSIESTIVELGTIFNQLATMVQQQEEMITRIDANVSDTVMNVEAAHESLLRYFASVTNNRWLILKVFGVLFFFFIVFVVLLA
jgi:syntaxin 5